MKKEVLLFTSGLDSYIAREYLIQIGHDIDCLYFTHGGRYTGWEQIYIQKLPFKVITSDILLFKDIEQPDAFIPNRNILMTTAANSLGYDIIWIGGSKSDRVCDNNESVFNQLSQFLTMMNKRYIKVDSPFWDCYKDDMIRWFVKTKDVMELVTNTFSCFNPLAKKVNVDGELEESRKKVTYETSECLKCPACFRKCAVMYSGGIFIPFKNNEIVEKYRKEFVNDIIENSRNVGTMKYIHHLKWMEGPNK